MCSVFTVYYAHLLCVMWLATLIHTLVSQSLSSFCCYHVVCCATAMIQFLCIPDRVFFFFCIVFCHSLSITVLGTTGTILWKTTREGASRCCSSFKVACSPTGCHLFLVIPNGLLYLYLAFCHRLCLLLLHIKYSGFHAFTYCLCCIMIKLCCAVFYVNKKRGMLSCN